MRVKKTTSNLVSIYFFSQLSQWDSFENNILCYFLSQTLFTVELKSYAMKGSADELLPSVRQRIRAKLASVKGTSRSPSAVRRAWKNCDSEKSTEEGRSATARNDSSAPSQNIEVADGGVDEADSCVGGTNCGREVRPVQITLLPCSCCVHVCTPVCMPMCLCVSWRPSRARPGRRIWPWEFSSSRAGAPCFRDAWRNGCVGWFACLRMLLASGMRKEMAVSADALVQDRYWHCIFIENFNSHQSQEMQQMSPWDFKYGSFICRMLVQTQLLIIFYRSMTEGKMLWDDVCLAFWQTSSRNFFPWLCELWLLIKTTVSSIRRMTMWRPCWLR